MKSSNKIIYLSGIQPSANLHIGNYFGAIQRWIEIEKDNSKQGTEDKNKSFFYMVADLHALTSSLYSNDESKKNVRQNIKNLAATFLACGLGKNKNSLIFTQSKIPQHLELFWALSCISPIGNLERMTQFKDKVKRQMTANLGLFSYPVLMSSDILLYQTNFVPVGSDQKQHVELAQDLSDMANNKLGSNVFTKPQPFINDKGSRVKSLIDGNVKMSKSDTSDKGYILLTESNDSISSKIKKAKTDSENEIYYDLKSRPEVSNLIEIMSLCQNKEINEIEQQYKYNGMSSFKEDLTSALIHLIDPIRSSYNELIKDESYIDDVLRNGSDSVSEVAEETMKLVRKACKY